MLSPPSKELLQRRLNRALTPRIAIFQSFLRASVLAAGPEGTHVRSQLFALEQGKRATNELEERARIARDVTVELLDLLPEGGMASAVDEAFAILDQQLHHEEQSIRREASRDLLSFGHGNSLSELDHSRRTILEAWQDEVELRKMRLKRGSASLAQLAAPRYDAPRLHWEKALRYSTEEPPDWENAAKEAVSAIEGLLKVVAKAPEEKLSRCVEILRSRGKLPPEFGKAAELIFGYASSTPGVRHGAAVLERVPPPEASFVIGFAEAMMRLLLSLDRDAE